MSHLQERFGPLWRALGFQAVFPSWRFFENVGHVPLLSYRVCNESADQDEEAANHRPWIAYQPVVERSWNRFFINATGNKNLATQTLIERLVDEVRTAGGTNQVTYELVARLVRWEILMNQVAAEPFRFQFKIDLYSQDPRLPDEIEVILSKEHVSR